MHVPETSKRRESGVIGDHAVGERWKAMMSELWRRHEDSRLVENVGSVGKLSEGREGADDDEAGRDRRELRECEGENGVIYDQQNKTEDRKEMSRWRQTMSVAARQKEEDGEDADEVRRGSMCYIAV